MNSKLLESLLIDDITLESVKSELDSNFVSKDKINLSSSEQKSTYP